MGPMRKVVGVLAGLVLLAGTARAGRRPFLYAYDAPTVPEGDVEIETWLDFIHPRHAGQLDEWRWFFGPRWSPTASVELSAFTSLAQTVQPPSVTELWAELLEARWRVLQSEPFGSLTLQIDLRI